MARNKSTGVKHIKNNTYLIDFQVAGPENRRQYRIKADSLKDARFIRMEHIAAFRRQLSIPQTEKDRFDASFQDVWEKLLKDVQSDDVKRKTIHRYQRTYWRMFGDFRELKYPHIKSVSQADVSFFKSYKSYYVNDLDRPTGWRAELILVKAIMNRLYCYGFCNRGIIDNLSEFKRPKRNKKKYPNIPNSKIRELLDYIKKDKPYYYLPIFFMYKTGRRREEVTRLEKKDVILNGFRPVRINVRAETTKMSESAPLEYLDDELEQIIRQALSNRKTKWLFPSKYTGRCTSDKIYEYLRRVSEEVIGVSITPHYFRHRFFTESARANVSQADVMAIAGLKDVKVLIEYYSHSTEEGQQKVFDVARL